MNLSGRFIWISDGFSENKFIFLFLGRLTGLPKSVRDLLLILTVCGRSQDSRIVVRKLNYIRNFSPTTLDHPVRRSKICPAIYFRDLYTRHAYVNILVTCVAFTSVGNEFCYNLFVL